MRESESVTLSRETLAGPTRPLTSSIENPGILNAKPAIPYEKPIRRRNPDIDSPLRVPERPMPEPTRTPEHVPAAPLPTQPVPARR